MLNKFLYLDDAGPNIRDATANGLSRTGILDVIAEEPMTWDSRESLILNNIQNIDGIILDWRLTEETDRAKSGAVKYSAEALAQHLRFLATDKAIKDLPIVLCSANDGFKEYYRKDSTGHDLFDEVFEKKDFSSNHDLVVMQLKCLAETYKKIQVNGKYSPKSVLSNPPNIDIDARIFDRINDLIKNMVPHELVGFLLNQIIKKPGILIDEDILAARLGIDRDDSQEGWRKMLDSIINPSIKYQGLLSEGWTRWWAEGFVQWWKENIDPVHPQFFSAKLRVKLIGEKTGIAGLKPAKKMKYCVDSEFWTACIATKKPIATSDGLRIVSFNEQPWQDEQYVSLYAFLEKIHSDSYKINPMEKERIYNLKKLIKNG